MLGNMLWNWSVMIYVCFLCKAGDTPEKIDNSCIILTYVIFIINALQWQFSVGVVETETVVLGLNGDRRNHLIVCKSFNS